MHASQARTSAPFLPSEHSLSKDISRFPLPVHILVRGSLLPAFMPELTHCGQSLSPLSSICLMESLYSDSTCSTWILYDSSLLWALQYLPISLPFTPCHQLTLPLWDSPIMWAFTSHTKKKLILMKDLSSLPNTLFITSQTTPWRQPMMENLEIESPALICPDHSETLNGRGQHVFPMVLGRTLSKPLFCLMSNSL